MRRVRMVGMAGMLVGLILSPGCGGPDRPPAEALVLDIARRLPSGWRVAPVSEAPAGLVPEAPAEALVAWRPEPVAVQSEPGRPAPPPEGAVLHLVVEIVPYVAPEDHRALRREYREIQRQYEDVETHLANIPRGPDGELQVRGVRDEGYVRMYHRELARLPELPPEPPPFHYRNLGIRIHDTRSVLVPEERARQTEFNLAYAAVTGALTPYRP